MQLIHSNSPFFNKRDDSCDIDAIIIHNISLPHRQFGTPYIEQLFLGELDSQVHPSFSDLKGMEVSAHLVIYRDGTVHQFVNFDDRAWHAGVSQLQGRSNCNDFSVGIELEGADDIPFTSAQYLTLSVVTKILQKHYGIDKRRIVGHSDIAPRRKTDPGQCFDWSVYRAMLE